MALLDTMAHEQGHCAVPLMQIEYQHGKLYKKIVGTINYFCGTHIGVGDDENNSVPVPPVEPPNLFKFKSKKHERIKCLQTQKFPKSSKRTQEPLQDLLKVYEELQNLHKKYENYAWCQIASLKGIFCTCAHCRIAPLSPHRVSDFDRLFIEFGHQHCKYILLYRILIFFDFEDIKGLP